MKDWLEASSKLALEVKRCEKKYAPSVNDEVRLRSFILLLLLLKYINSLDIVLLSIMTLFS